MITNQREFDECKIIIGFVTEVIKRKKSISPPNPLRIGGLIFIKNITEVYSHSIVAGGFEEMS